MTKGETKFNFIVVSWKGGIISLGTHKQIQWGYQKNKENTKNKYSVISFANTTKQPRAHKGILELPLKIKSTEWMKQYQELK